MHDALFRSLAALARVPAKGVTCTGRGDPRWTERIKKDVTYRPRARYRPAPLLSQDMDLTSEMCGDYHLRRLLDPS